MATLKDVLDLLDCGEDDRIKVTIKEREHSVRFVTDTYSITDGTFFLAGFEYSAHVLICAGSFEDAWSTWVDTLPPIAEDELIEAFGVVDRDDVREAYERGHGECPRWGDQEAWRVWHDGLKLAQTWWLANVGNDLTNPLDPDGPLLSDDTLNLIEGYEYQSNATGTGIVNVGHYAWMNEIDPAAITFEGIEHPEKKAKKSA